MSTKNLTLIIRLISGLLLVCAAYALFEAKAQESWPHVIGRIISSDTYLDMGPKRVASWKVKCNYEYYVEGKQYNAVMVLSKKDKLDAVRDVSRFPVDARIPVYYAPNNLTKSTLEPGHDFGASVIALFVCLGIFFLSPALAWIIETNRKK